MPEIDLVAMVNGIAAFVMRNWELLVAGSILFLILRSSGFLTRLRRVIEDLFFTNWQLALLASTGIALSLASGYTTWAGLRNFTNQPWLSMLIAFGIQGVMLIVAWLIGESFAIGMSTVHRRGYARAAVPLVVVVVGLASVCLLAAFGVFWWRYGVAPDLWMKGFVLAAAAMGVIVLLMLFSKSDVIAPYAQAVRIITKNSVLWVMFFASMAASVFFSFDSHFNAIFPAEARKRAAEIRTVNQIGEVIADVGALAQKRQIEEAEALFNTDGWKAYDKQLAGLAHAAQGAQGEIEKYFVQQMEERRRAINQQQERIASAQGGQAGLANKKISLTEELSRLRAERPGLAAEYAQHKSELDAKGKEIDAKRVEALAEDRGVEGTMKQGRGPVYRQRMAEFGMLHDQYKIAEERTRDAQKRIVAVQTRLAQIERELATVDGDLAKLKGEAETAQQRIKSVESAGSGEEGTKLDPTRVLPAFERARASFHQHPDAERLAMLQQQCTNLANAMSSTQATKDMARAIDCDHKQAAEAAAGVFALNAGLVAFQANCAKGEKLAQYTTTDALLAFGRKCVQDSGLTSKDSSAIGARLSAIEMNRDDKAHRFVVTWNAFLDGNRLAYLALTLAIGVDALVFMSGLFGANAIRSPLSDVPSIKARSAEQLEGIIKNALGEDRLENAELVLAAMTPTDIETDYHAEIDLTRYGDETGRRIRKVLVAGSSIGAVKRAAGTSGERYLVRSELFEYLSLVANTARESDSEHASQNRLVRIVGVALEPQREKNAAIVLEYAEPINQRNGFMAKVNLDSVNEHKRLVQNVLNAAMTLNAVQRHDRSTRRSGGLKTWLPGAGGIETTYFISADLFKALLFYRAGSPVLGEARGPERQLTNGRDHSAMPELAPTRQVPRLTNGAVEAEDARLKEQFKEQLLAALDLNLSALDKISAPEITKAAIGAANILKRHARTNDKLNGTLKLVESDSKRALEQAHELLALQYDDNDHATALLDNCLREITEVLPALMLLPEGKLIEELISALEEGEADDRLTDKEHSLLSRLQKVKVDLERMKVGEASAWNGIARELEHLKDPAALSPHTVGDERVH
jgi:hypothetical protein